MFQRELLYLLNAFRPRRRILRRACAVAGVLLLTATASSAQPYVPGSTYFDRSNYIQYAAGDLPFVLSAPHGGTLTPAEIPDRTNCPTCPGWDFTTVTDTATDDVANRVRTAVANLTGHLPHIIICHLDRSKIDCNRAIDEGAEGNPAAVIAWTDFQNYIDVSSNAIIGTFGRGFYIDQHGQGHPEERLELGYLLSMYDLTNTDARLDSVSSYKNSSSIRTLANSVASSNSFSQLLRGTNSFGQWMVVEGYPSTPSFTTPAPFTDPTSSSNYFDGGYNTDVHGSDNGGPLSALQIEANYAGVRDTAANRIAYSQSLARVVEKYFAAYYGMSLRMCAPSVWDAGSGNWSNTNDWALGISPVSSNLLFFAGSGGSMTHDLAALAGTGVVSALVFSNAASAAYTLSGNAITMNGGITSDNAFNNTINNNLALPSNCPVSVTAGTLTLAGILSGGGFAKSGAGTLALTASNTCSGTVTNQGGFISLNATSTLGTGPLVLAGGNILSLNTRTPAPLSNAILMTANAVIAGNGTLTNSTRVLPFAANNIVTTGGTLTIRNGGSNPFSTNDIFLVRLTGGGFNFTQPIVIGSAADLPVDSSQLQSYNDNLTPDQTFSGPISGWGQFRRDAAVAGAAGRTILSGSNTYSGGTLVTAGTLLVNNPTGSGTGTGAVTVGSSGILDGSGTIAGPVSCAGQISAGQGAGLLTLGSGLDLSAGGTNLWDLSVLSDAGAGTNFDQLALTGGVLTLGGSARLQLNFINSAVPPTNSSPFWMMSHTWKIIALSGSAANSGPSAFPIILNGNYSTGRFTNTTDVAGSVLLSYVANPAARPLLQSFQPASPGAFTLTAATETNRTYVLQSATNLIGAIWSPVSTNVAPGSLLVLTNIPGASPMQFYRLVVVP